MDSDIHMFMVNGQTTTPMTPPSGLATQGLLETVHLEQWVVDNPQVLGGDIRIVTTQYDKWSSQFGGTRPKSASTSSGSTARGSS